MKWIEVFFYCDSTTKFNALPIVEWIRLQADVVFFWVECGRFEWMSELNLRFCWLIVKLIDELRTKVLIESVFFSIRFFFSLKRVKCNTKREFIFTNAQVSRHNFTNRIEPMELFITIIWIQFICNFSPKLRKWKLCRSIFPFDFEFKG